jgi:hypothetical protein
MGRTFGTVNAKGEFRSRITNTKTYENSLNRICQIAPELATFKAILLLGGVKARLAFVSHFLRVMASPTTLLEGCLDTFIAAKAGLIRQEIDSSFLVSAMFLKSGVNLKFTCIVTLQSSRLSDNDMQAARSVRRPGGILNRCHKTLL